MGDDHRKGCICVECESDIARLRAENEVKAADINRLKGGLYRALDDYDKVKHALAVTREALRQADDVACQALHDLDELRRKHRFCEPAEPPDDLRAEVARLRAELEQCADDVPDSAEIARRALAAPPAPAPVAEERFPYGPDVFAPAPAAAPAPPAVPPAGSEAQCVFGQRCERHDFIHGAEAEQLREKMEALTQRLEGITGDEIQRILDRVDARDSLAWREAREREETERAHPVASPPAVPEKCAGYCRPPGEACSAQCARRPGHEGRCSCKPDASPSAAPDKRGTCLGCGGTGGLGAICPNCAGTGRAPTGGGR